MKEGLEIKKKRNKDSEIVSFVIVFRRDDGVRVEEQLQLSHLQQLMYWFEMHKPPTIVQNNGSIFGAISRKPNRQPGLLTLEEFKDTLVKVMGTHAYDDQMENLFTKLDTSCDGYVDWNEFCTYMLLQFRENDYMRAKKQIPFTQEPRIRHIVHNRQETTTRVVAVEGPLKYVTISKEGAMSVFDNQLHFEKFYDMTESEGEQWGGQKRRVKMWVTDAIYMSDAHKIAIATTGRDIRFFDATSNVYFEEYHLYSLQDVPYCFDYHCDKKHPGYESLLIYGDDKGAINILTFNRPLVQLFASPFKKEPGVQKIYFQELCEHSQWVRHQRLEDIHPEIIRKVMYMPENESIISSSASPRNSLVIMDIGRKKKTYIWKVSKGIECFDYNKNINVIVTGNQDHLVRIWNPYVISKPVAIFEGHSMGIVDVCIHERLNQVFSYCRDATLKVWDIKEHVCLQTIILKFPSSLLGRLPEYGQFPMRLQLKPGKTLIVTANDYIGMIKLGDTGPPVSPVPTTHMTQLCSALYNPYFKTVTTGADDSTVAVWELESGAKSMLFTNTHGNEEITCMTFDGTWRRLITGARNGTIKIWNIQNGHNLHELEPVSELEVTGIVPLNERKMFLSVGWSRVITLYEDSDQDNHNVKAITTWKGGQVHQEDILAVAYLPPSILATASFDGEICVWSIETENMFLRLRKARTNTRGSKRSGRPSRSASNPSSSGSRLGTPQSRPNSRHRKSHRPLPGQAAPVDKLLFLPSRAKVKGSDAAVLISSEAGTLRWWSIYGAKKEVGYFYAPETNDESVLALCTNPNNSVLVSGDTQGKITVWNILNYCTAPENHRVRSKPEVECLWQAHEAAVVSVEYITHDTGVYIVSASTDRTAKLFTIHGLCVGTFGQKTLWNLKNPSTWCEPLPDAARDDEHVNEEDNDMESQDEEDDLLEDIDTLSELNIEREVTIPTLERGDTLLPEVKDSSVSPRATRGTKSLSVGPSDASRHSNTYMNLKNRSQTFAFGSDKRVSFSARSMLGAKVDRHLARVKKDRKERRENTMDLGTRETYRMGMSCPYTALPTSELRDVSLPFDLPVTPRMQNIGYNSNSLIRGSLSTMDLSYYDKPSSNQEDPFEGPFSDTSSRRMSKPKIEVTSVKKSDSKLPSIGRSRSQVGGFGPSRKGQRKQLPTITA